MKALKLIMFACCIINFSCKDSFSPEIDSNYKDLLVVDGFIDIGGITTIKVGRSIDLSDSRASAPEKNATISVLGEDGVEIKGRTNELGECLLPTQNLDLAKKYKLRIILADTKIYETSFLTNKATPEIDNLRFSATDHGFNILLNTYDDSNTTKYYTWDYEETWEVRVPYVSTHEFKNSQVVLRDPNINIQHCWANSSSSNILLGSTARISQDRITDAPITFVAGNSIKLAYLYSILVRQYGLTKEAYEYLENLKKNTEQIGGIFDPQPSEMKGNIQCISDPKEQVMGWISAGRMVQKRLFIKDSDKPSINSDWVYVQPCEGVVIPKDSLINYLRANKVIVNEQTWVAPGTLEPILYRYTMSTAACIDCRLKGSNIKPSFWPN